VWQRRVARFLGMFTTTHVPVCVDEMDSTWNQEILFALSAAAVLAQYDPGATMDLGHDPVRKQRLEAWFKDLDPVLHFKSLVYRYGMDQFSTPDLIATFCAVEWEIVNERPPSREGLHRLRDRVREAILRQNAVL
jgi:hypothetical protein